MTLMEELKELLKEDARLILEGKLLKNTIVEMALKLDKDLIKLLMKNEKVKQHFFRDIDGILVFDKEKFIKFIDNKEFLPDSYTTFKNKIGLMASKEYISKSKEVVLVWPFKDCVLEGGQEKSDEKRQEIFYNEILAPDEIDRLLEPKVFTNFKRIDKYGEHEVTEIKPADNLIIKGNNLLVLYSLKKRFSGKIKLIYIDPPYNTGSDEFKYNDNFNHSTWLTFMKNRLEVAKELLKKDGAIFVQIDDNEQAYLKVLMDEIFGRENFKEDIAVMIGSESGVNAINVMRGEQLFRVKEHILYYTKNAKLHRFKPIYVRAMDYNMSYRLEVIKTPNGYQVNDVYKKLLQEMFGQDKLTGLTDEQKELFLIKFKDYCLKNAENIYALKTDIQKSGDNFKNFAKQNRKKGIVEEYTTSDGRVILVYKGGMLTPLSQRIVVENGKKYYGKLISDFWWDIGATPSSEGGVNLKGGKKAEKMIKRIIELTTEPGDIVLDFFMGTGTTCAVAHKMGRQYIGIEQLDYGENDALIRLKKVINGDSTGISKEVGWNGGGDFVYMELKKLNEVFVEKIRNAKTSKELLSIWDEMKQNGFLSYRINPVTFDKNRKDFEALKLEEQKRLLIEMLDKNELYVNLSEIDDIQYQVSEEDKKLNKQFYEGRF
ncbi:MAG TPA: site-specific DNA-methyltransferase [Clostridia bacterium]|nr:site-specific DNA-methyltransferase [Clostridia bacterium]